MERLREVVGIQGEFWFRFESNLDGLDNELDRI